MSPAKVPPKPSAPKPGKETIYIDPEDEITAIIDKVESAKQKVVALVLPKRAATLQSIVNMRLLKRSATSAGKNVVLITNESALLPLAGAAGLHVAKNLQSKPAIPPSPRSVEPAAAEPEQEELDEVAQGEEPTKLDYHRAVGELAAADTAKDETETIALENDEPATPVPKAAPAKTKGGKGLKVPNFDRFRALLALGGAALIALIIFIILAIWVLPKAKITVQTTSTPISANFTLRASDSAKTLDEDAKIIPSTLKTSDQTATQQVNATGQKNLGDKATGSVTMSAGACSADVPGDVPAGTGVSTNGLTFITQERASFSPTVSGSKCTYKSNSVDITAQEPGSKYNTSLSNVSVAGYSSITASGSASGGTDNNVTVLTQQDVDNAKSKITSADSDKFNKDFQQQLKDDGYYVITSTLKISEPAVTSTPAIGAQTSNATVNIKITYSVVAVQRDDLEKLITDVLNKQIDKTKVRISSDDVVRDASITAQGQQGNSANVDLAVAEDTTAVPILDVDGIKKQAAGKKSGEIKSNISTIPGVKKVDVDLSPFWLSHAPKKTSKITVVQQQIKQDK